MRVLFSTTGNDGHFGPVRPFARACADAGHEVRVAAPASYAEAVGRAGFAPAPFADAPPEPIGPVWAQVPALPYEEAQDLVVREVFARIDAQAALPALTGTIARWRPDLVVRESAELGSLAAAERAGVPHVQVSIGMHEVVHRFAEGVAEQVDELGSIAGLASGDLVSALAAESVLSLVPEILDHPTGEVPPAPVFHRYGDPPPPVTARRSPDWGDPDRPLVYVTFGTVAGTLPRFAGAYREALDATADLDACVLMTVGRRFDLASLGPVPANARVLPWVPQAEVLAHAAALLGHGGFGTTLGALAAGVPQAVAPLFSFDQVVNGDHVAAVGAGHTAGPDDPVVPRAAAALPTLLGDPSYAGGARRVATALDALPPPAAAVPLLERLVT